MKRLFAQPLCRTTLWTRLVCLLLLVLIMAACGEGDLSTHSSPSPTKPTKTTPPISSSSQTATPGSSLALQVKVTEMPGSNGGKAHYAFSPSTFMGHVGDIVTFVNASDATHALISAPAGAITTGSILDLNETQAVELLQPGSFTISSHTHPEAKLTATIRGSAGDVLPPQMVVLSQKPGTKVSYFFSPTNVGVDVGYAILILNQTNQTQVLMITPTDGVVVESVLERNETQLLQFSAEYDYTITIKDHPEATLLVCSD